MDFLVFYTFFLVFMFFLPKFLAIFSLFEFQWIFWCSTTFFWFSCFFLFFAEIVTDCYTFHICVNFWAFYGILNIFKYCVVEWFRIESE